MENIHVLSGDDILADKYYAVRNGKKTGIFNTWEECKEQVNGYKNAEYKSFKNIEDAKLYMGLCDDIKKGEEAGVMTAYVDGSYSDSIPAFSYGLIAFLEGEVIRDCKMFQDENLIGMRNVAGEIKGAETAMALAISKGCRKLRIYHDYEGIAKWCLGTWRTNKEGTRAYKAYYDSVCDKVEISFHKVTGHSGNKYNDEADRLAKSALGIK